METTQLTDGVPLVQNGVFTPKTLEQLAELVAPAVGRALGVQRTSFNMDHAGWIRLLKTSGRSGGFIQLSNYWGNARPGAMQIAFGAGHKTEFASLTQISGDSELYTKCRIVFETMNDVYVDVYTPRTNTSTQPINLSVWHTDTAVLVGSYTTEEIPEGAVVSREITLTRMGGGKHLYVNALRCLKGVA